MIFQAQIAFAITATAKKLPQKLMAPEVASSSNILV